MVQVYGDGSCRSNGSEDAVCGVGIVVKEDNLTLARLSMRYRHLQTNNEAEYAAILEALNWLSNKNHENKQILIYSDSKLVVNQLNNKWQIKKKNLYYFYVAIKKTLNAFDNVKIRWIPREKNNEANDLAQEITEA